MTFNSLNFVLFFIVVTPLYFLAAHRLRWALLLAASCFFYMAFIPAYILILLVTILIDYTAGIYIYRTQGRLKKALLILSIISTCLVLFIFKYFDFFNSNLALVARFLDWNYSPSALHIILPIGLSFHTFQSLAYVIEVYRGNQKPEYHFGIYALYVMFYPQLVAGPIERPQNLLHQFRRVHAFHWPRISNGLKLMAWGMFKKVVIADRLALTVNHIYDEPFDHYGFTLILATIFFAFQIYCDFSGYCDIALGSAMIMGFKLMDNFNYPYFSRSISEFWRRWHISLSTWFRDYVYIPLGGSRVTPSRLYFNLLAVFLLSGLWHGANWTFVIWGALNGLYLVASLLTKDIRPFLLHKTGLDSVPRLHAALQVAFTFSLACLAWVFFRAQSLSDALSIIGRSFSAAPNGMYFNLAAERGQNIYLMLVGVMLVAMLLFIESSEFSGRRFFKTLRAQPIYIRWSAWYVLILFFMLFGVFHNPGQFIYFQF